MNNKTNLSIQGKGTLERKAFPTRAELLKVEQRRKAAQEERLKLHNIKMDLPVQRRVGWASILGLKTKLKTQFQLEQHVRQHGENEYQACEAAYVGQIELKAELAKLHRRRSASGSYYLALLSISLFDAQARSRWFQPDIGRLIRDYPAAKSSIHRSLAYLTFCVGCAYLALSVRWQSRKRSRPTLLCIQNHLVKRHSLVTFICRYFLNSYTLTGAVNVVVANNKLNS